MFYENYLRLCNDRGITPSAAAVDMGLTKAANTKWAAGKTPRDATLKKIADYFEVTIPYLMGETDDRTQKNSPGQVTEAELDEELVRFWNSADDTERKALMDAVQMIEGLRKK